MSVPNPETVLMITCNGMGDIIEAQRLAGKVITLYASETSQRLLRIPGR